MKFDAPWLQAPETQQLFDVFADHALYAVGGCVRDTLLGVPVSDVDMSTSARPNQVIEIAQSAGLQAIPTGIDHGTITIVVSEEAYEITTFRKDIETDGRHARVSFSEDMREDAQRRDFTINALYADRHGNVLDPVDGLPDIKARRIHFINDAEMRIREDYLRILRYFRFFAWYADHSAGFESDAIAAVAAHSDKLALISKERITSEVLRIFAAPDPDVALAGMVQTGVMQTVLGGSFLDIYQRYAFWSEDFGLAINPLGRMASYAPVGAEKMLCLTRKQNKNLEKLRHYSTSMVSAGELGFRLGRTDALHVLSLRAAILDMPPANHSLEDVKRGAQAKFPIAAKDLMGSFSGRELGQELARLEHLWIASDFELTKADLLSA